LDLVTVRPTRGETEVAKACADDSGETP